MKDIVFMKTFNSKNSLIKNLLLIVAVLFITQINAHPPVYAHPGVHGHHDVYIRPGVYVKVRPSHLNVVVVHPACPSPKHIWIDGEWIWNPQINNYAWQEGRWDVPQPYSKWVPGHWKQTNQGYYWIPGHWKQIN